MLDEGVLPPCKALKTNPKKMTMITNAYRNEEWSHFSVRKVQYARTMALDIQWEFHTRYGEKFNKMKSKMKVRNWNGNVLTLAFAIMLCVKKIIQIGTTHEDMFLATFISQEWWSLFLILPYCYNSKVSIILTLWVILWLPKHFFSSCALDVKPGFQTFNYQEYIGTLIPFYTWTLHLHLVKIHVEKKLKEELKGIVLTMTMIIARVVECTLSLLGSCKKNSKEKSWKIEHWTFWCPQIWSFIW